jgi:hypothetical protein
VTDTGVKVDSCFFTDYSKSYIDANNVTQAPNKVVDYFAYFNRADGHGRGTHIAGEQGGTGQS